MSMDVMIDLETTGTSAGCCILSIGACSFDLNHTFYTKIAHDTCRSVGLTDDPDTLRWWASQDKLAYEEAFSGETSIVKALGDFQTWINRLPEDKDKIFVWGNGADFDLPILADAFKVTGIKVPWKPYNGRCYRTLKNLYKAIKMQPFMGQKHNALADAKNQAQHARDILRIHFDASQD